MPEPCDRRVEQPVDLINIGDLSGPRDYLGPERADLGRDALEAVLVTLGEHQVGVVSRECDGARRPIPSPTPVITTTRPVSVRLVDLCGIDGTGVVIPRTYVTSPAYR